MASTSEVGHAKNVANLETLIIDCQNFGARYNPANPLITTTALQALYASSANAIADVAAKTNTLNHSINTRHVDFSTIKAKATQIMAALKASGADAQTMVNAQTINRKIQGSRAAKQSAASVPAPAPTPSGSTPGSVSTPTTGTANKQVNLPTTPVVIISVSQQSFDKLVDNLAALVNYVSQYPAYHPNETNLTVTALNALVVYLTTSNNNVKTAQAALSSSRANRTLVLYDKTTGLVEIAKEVKAYVKSVFNASSPQYKQVSAVPFKTDVSTNHRKHLKK